MDDLTGNMGFLNLEKIKLKLGSEKISFFDEIKKKTFGILAKFKNINFIITNRAIYNLKKDEIKTRKKN